MCRFVKLYLITHWLLLIYRYRDGRQTNSQRNIYDLDRILIGPNRWRWLDIDRFMAYLCQLTFFVELYITLSFTQPSERDSIYVEIILLKWRIIRRSIHSGFCEILYTTCIGQYIILYNACCALGFHRMHRVAIESNTQSRLECWG